MISWSPEQWALFLGASTTVIASVAAAAVKIIVALKGVEHKVDALEIKVDGRLTQLLDRTALASNLAGREAGREAGRSEIATPVLTEPALDPEGQLVVKLPVPVPPILLLPTEEEKD